MSDPMKRHHGLESVLLEVASERTTDPVAQVTIRGDLGFINLRGNPDDSEFVAAVEELLGQSLPVTPNTISAGTKHAFWLGPDEWLIALAAGETRTVVETLQQAMSGFHAAVNDITGGQTAMLLQGAAARKILAKGCPLDLYPSAFHVGACAQSGLAKASVVLGLLDDAPTFMIVARRSFSDYLCRWLTSAGSDVGIVFSEA